MKRISLIAMSLAAVLLTVGCGKGHGDREIKQDAKALTHDAANDASRVFQDARDAARDLSHAAESTAVGAESDVRQAAVELHDDLHSRDHVDADYHRPPDPAQLQDQAKRDAVNAAGAAAEEAAEKLLKLNR